MTQSFEIKVTCSGGAYTTNTVRGERASSTCGAEQAAERLGPKLFPETFLRVEQLAGQAGDGCSVTRWRVLASTEI